MLIGCNISPTSMDIEEDEQKLRPTYKRTRNSVQEETTSSNHSSDEDNWDIEVTLERRASRAREIRQTVAYNEQKLNNCEMRIPANNSGLFDCVVLVNVEQNDSGIHQPIVKYCFPETNAELVRPELLLPDFMHMTKLQYDSSFIDDTGYMVSLTDNQGIRRYVYCIRFMPIIDPEEQGSSKLPLVLGILTSHRNYGFYRELAQNAANFAKSGVPVLDRFLASIYSNPYPRPGSSLIVVKKNVDGLIRKYELKNNGARCDEMSASEVIRRIGPEISVCAIAALLGEQRLLIAGDSVHTVTHAVNTFEHLLRPLNWPHTQVSMIPDHLSDLCHNPTPYIMGILRTNLTNIKELIADNLSEDALKDNFVLIDIDNGLMIPPPMSYPEKVKLESWRTTIAVCFCLSLGMPKKVSLHLINLFRNALQETDHVLADERIESAMYEWFSALFGHFRVVHCDKEWTEKTKKKLISTAISKYHGAYLKYLIETIMFDEWIKQRFIESTNGSACPLEVSRLEMTQEKLPLVAEKTPINKLLNKVSSAFHLNGGALAASKS